MADILRVIAREPDLQAAARVHLIEASPVLRGRQRETLREAAAPVAWHGGLDTVPAGPLLLVANEFFDALPVRQHVRAGNGLRERVVGLDEAGNLAFAVGPAAPPGVPHGFDAAPVGAIVETRPAADPIIAAIAERVVAEGGAALIVDYGHGETAPGDTLQAVRGHAYADPLAEPGLADLTAHVDFAPLARRAVACGAACHGPIGQGAFLRAAGLNERAAALAKGRSAAVRRDLCRAVERLGGEGEMGRLFKVMALTRPGHLPPPFHTGARAGV